MRNHRYLLPHATICDTARCAARLIFTLTNRAAYIRQFLAYSLYRWRSSFGRARFGILGVATLGYYVDAAISELRLDVAVFPIFGVAALSMSVDAFSRRLRRRLRIEMLPTRLAQAPESSREVA